MAIADDIVQTFSHRLFRHVQHGQFATVSDRHNLAKAAYDVPSLLDNYQVIDRLLTAMNELG